MKIKRNKFLVMTATGTTAPEFVHDDYESAQKEAVRLHHKHDCATWVLEVVCEVSKQQVPVTELKTVVDVDERHKDLPF